MQGDGIFDHVGDCLCESKCKNELLFNARTGTFQIHGGFNSKTHYTTLDTPAIAKLIQLLGKYLERRC